MTMTFLFFMLNVIIVVLVIAIQPGLEPERMFWDIVIAVNACGATLQAMKLIGGLNE